jgi:hypothetical protein
MCVADRERGDESALTSTSHADVRESLRPLPEPTTATLPRPRPCQPEPGVTSPTLTLVLCRRGAVSGVQADWSQSDGF